MTATKKTLKARYEIIRAIREFFHSQKFIEVETPLLVVSPGMEPHLEAFQTRFVTESGSESRELFLPTSPEFHMKRLLVRGHQRIFQITHSFRNGEVGGHHQPEFCMLEWYRANRDYTSIMRDTEELVFHVATHVVGSSVIGSGAGSIDLTPPWERLTVREAWQRYTGIDLDRCSDATTLRREGQALNVEYLLDTDTYDEVYFKIFLSLIEPELGKTRPTILMEYPASMAALSRLKPEDPSVALRFEVYARGLELGNAFDELTDVNIQLQRCKEAQQEQIDQGKVPFPIDTAFIKALRDGMPPSAGIAVGVDRLVMLLLEKQSIEEVVAFPFS